jgi:hypothetical protein
LISVSELVGRGKVRSKASFEMTTPPSSSITRGGWKMPATVSRTGFPAGERNVKPSPTARSCFFAKASFTSAPWPSSFASVTSEPCFHWKW